MANERLRGAIAGAGLTLDRVAEHAGVDPKTIERWITQARLPHRGHRWATAALLGTDEAYLWPESINEGRAQSASKAELVTLYPHRGSVPPELLTTLAAKATEAIDVLVYAGLFLTDSTPDLPQTLAVRASKGTRVRLLLGEPDSAAVRLRGEEEGIGDGLAARVRISLTYLRRTAEAPGVELRLHGTTLYNSLLRFDDDLLVNAHVFGAPAAQSPVLHLRRVPGGRLFGHYVESFERVWETASFSASVTDVAGDASGPARLPR